MYFVPIGSWIEVPGDKLFKIVSASENALGTETNCLFSPDGTIIAYLNTPYANEADVRLLMAHVASQSSFDVLDTVIERSWDLVPDSSSMHPAARPSLPRLTTATGNHCLSIA